MRLGFGVSMSQRLLAQEVFIGAVGDDGTSSAVDTSTTPYADTAITGATISITTNVGTVTLTNHGLKGGDRIAIYGCAEPRLNVAPVVVTVLTANTFTVPITLPDGSYSTTGGYVKFLDPLLYAYNGAGYLFENITTTNGSLVFRRNGKKFRSSGAVTVSTTTATQTNTSPYTDAFNASSNFEQYMNLDELNFRSFAADGLATMSGINKYTQGFPDEDKDYHIQIRAKNLKTFSRPVARITAIAKTGTTTATVTTDVAHGLTATSYVQIYGVRDQTNFPNLTAQTLVASIVNSTQFTIVIGSATTTSSAGGAVWTIQGSNVAPGGINNAIQSISRTSNILSVVTTALTTPLPGEYIQLHGMDGSGAAYDGAYKVLRVAANTAELESIGADFGTINCGGAIIKRTDVRIHYTKVLDYTRLVTEIVGGRGNTTDINNSVPVSIAGGAAISSTQSTGTSSSIWNAAGWGGFLVADIASAAITTTATTAAVSPGAVVNIGTYAHAFHIAVTATSGTNQTMDVQVQESPDNGTNWIPIYDFPRITATGSYQSPLIRATWGTRYRYVQTIAGTTPSFTRVLNRLQFSNNPPLTRQFIDRSIVLTTLNSTTPTYFVDGIDTAQLVVNVGAITTTAPQLQLEGSDDTTNWYLIGSPLTAVASSTVILNYTGLMPKYVRACVSTAGVGVTAGYIGIKGTSR